MKKIISLIVAFVMIIGLVAGCSKDDETSKAGNEWTTEQKIEKANEIFSKSFNATTVEALTPLVEPGTPAEILEQSAASAKETIETLGVTEIQNINVEYIEAFEGYDIFYFWWSEEVNNVTSESFGIAPLLRIEDSYYVPNITGTPIQEKIYNRYTICPAALGRCTTCNGMGYIASDEAADTSADNSVVFAPEAEIYDPSSSLTFGEIVPEKNTDNSYIISDELLGSLQTDSEGTVSYYIDEDGNGVITYSPDSVTGESGFAIAGSVEGYDPNGNIIVVDPTLPEDENLIVSYPAIQITPGIEMDTDITIGSDYIVSDEYLTVGPIDGTIIDSNFIICPDCDGSGSNQQPQNCEECNGRGYHINEN